MEPYAYRWQLFLEHLILATHTVQLFSSRKLGSNTVGFIWKDEADSLLALPHNQLQGALSLIFNAFLTFSCCWSSLFNLVSTALASLFFRIAVWIALFCLEDCQTDKQKTFQLTAPTTVADARRPAIYSVHLHTICTGLCFKDKYKLHI